MDQAKRTDMLDDELQSADSVAGQLSDQPLIDVLLTRLVVHKRQFFTIALLALLVSTIVAFLIPKQYQSTTRIMPPEGQNPAAMLALISGKVPAGLGEIAGSLMGNRNPGPLYTNLLQSRTVLDDQVSRFDLQKVYRTKYREGARKKLESRTTISEDRKSGVITIEVTDTDRARAVALANGYVTELDQLLAKVSTSSARRERIFIENRLESAKKDLGNAQEEFGRFASRNSTLDIGEQARAMVGASADVQGQIIVAESELKGIERIYAGSNVRIQALKARIEELKRQQAKIGGLDTTRIAELAPGELYPTIRQLPIMGIKWADLYREAKIQQNVYELLRQQYELTRIQEAREVPTVRVVDPADFPEQKRWPPRLLIMLVGSLIGVLGFFFLEWLQLQPVMVDEHDPWRRRLNLIASLSPRGSFFNFGKKIRN